MRHCTPQEHRLQSRTLKKILIIFTTYNSDPDAYNTDSAPDDHGEGLSLAVLGYFLAFSVSKLEMKSEI